MTVKYSQDHHIGQIVEHQMSQWEHAKNIEHRGQMIAHLASGAEVKYITISRQLGSGGEEIAQILSDLMSWELYDKDILNYMADNMDVQVKALETVDEQTIGWINDWLVPFFDKSGQHVEQLSYYKHLGKVLLVIARHGKAVIVGRAAGQILPREKGLSVRVIAPYELRCQHYAQQQRVSLVEARAIVRKTDEAQRRFVKDFLGKDINDSSLYDLVINTEKLSPKSVAKIIWRGLDERVVSRHDHEKKIMDIADIARVVEHQMKKWQQNRKGPEDHPTLQLAGGKTIDYIAINRQVGSGGTNIAEKLSELMNWQVFDKKILDYMAENMDVHVKALESVDERTKSWINQRLSSLFVSRNSETVSQKEYCKHLAEVLMVIAEHGNAIIIGRGATYLLDRDKGLNVRVISPLKNRIANYAKLFDLTENEATAIIKKADRDQTRFIKTNMQKDINDASAYDLVCNTEKLIPLSVAKLIWRVLDQRVSQEAELV